MVERADSGVRPMAWKTCEMLFVSIGPMTQKFNLNADKIKYAP